MKKLNLFLLAALCLTAQAFGQAAYSGTLNALTTETITGRTVIVPAPLASITVYAAGTTNKSLVCTDATGGSCASTAPSNPFPADSQGNFGFYIAAGAYDYTITPVSGTVQGPYRINLPLGITLPSTISLSGVTIPASSGGTGVNNTATSGRYLKGNGTGFATSTGSASGVGTPTACSNQFVRTLTLNSDAAPTSTCASVTTTDTDTTIAKTGIDVNTSNQVTVTHLAAALPVAQGGTGVTSSTGSGATVLGTSPTLTTPNISAPTISGNASMASATMSGTVTSYNGIALSGSGLLSGVAEVSLTAQTAAITTTTLYAVPSSGQGQYIVDWSAKVTTAAGTSSTLGALTIVYTDPDGVAITITAPAFISAGTVATTSTANTTSTVLLGAPLHINAKASTNITYAFAYASNAANAMNYNLHIKVLAE